MKCEMCNYQTSPDNMPILIQHMAICENPKSREAQVVWRNMELTATLTVQEAPAEKKTKKAKTDLPSEVLFEVEVPAYEAPPIPPAAEPIRPVETSVTAKKASNDQE
jgi:hypothetical protein